MRYLTITLISGLLIASPGLRGAESGSLVTDFWTADSDSERSAAAADLLETNPDPVALYARLKNGPVFPTDAPTGVVEHERVGSDGLRFPWVILVPDSYDSTQRYPVEVLLHGGVGRDAPEEGETFWRRGYDALRAEDRIVVVPAAWNESFWWFPNQAENLSAILRRLKSDYNIAENQVSLTGISDGGTGAYFFAFKQPSEWAAFFAYIGHPGVLRNPAGRASYNLYFENLLTTALYIVNGESDPLYAARTVQPFVDVLSSAGVNHVFRVIEDGGHNTDWMPAEAEAIEQFRRDNPRDPLPDSLQWVTDTTDRFNRLHWLVVNELAEPGQPGLARARRDGNIINVDTVSVDQVTLLLSPEEVDFSQPIAIYVNGALRQSDMIDQSSATLLKWAARDLDRTHLYTAEITLRTD